MGLFPGSSIDVIIPHAFSDPIILLIKMDLGRTKLSSAQRKEHCPGSRRPGSAADLIAALVSPSPRALPLGVPPTLPVPR